ncbi:hypothetical protein [Pseudonocardia sp. MH-G8]|uniref:hypothetical protein n=1 Tax=Pseudonocardia sp. MH-G8 TaxID=1854588 RepID=UPI00117A98B7|nr:hypothetical protein [Pseudonocardia sp. MH-G8]
MSPVRRPVIVGLARGIGTSTLAAALHATDGALLRPGTAVEADVLLCPADAVSLRNAAALACAPSGPRPVLVLAGTPGPPVAPPRAVHGLTAVLALPHLARWTGRADARGSAGAVLAFPPETLPGDVASYAAALRDLVEALTESGLLRRRTPPPVSRPVAGGLRRGLQPSARPVACSSTSSSTTPSTAATPIVTPPLTRPPLTPARTTTAPAPAWAFPGPEPDDDTLEAGPPPLPAGRAG